MVNQKGLSVSMNAKLTGSGDEVVVLAHGYGGDQSFWDKVGPTLAQKHQVVVFDWNFSGVFNEKGFESESGLGFDPIKHGSFEGFADDLVDMLDEMGIKSCSFVGHSISAMIGCFASIKRPQLFNNLILIGASPRYLNSEDYEGGFEMGEIEKFLSTMEANFELWASYFAPLAMGSQDTIFIEKFEKSLKRMKPEVAIAVAKLIFLGDNRHVLEHVNTPCTLVTTTNDIVVPSSVTNYMQKKMIKIKSKVEIIDVRGHFPHLTAPDNLLQVLGRALD